MLYIRTDNYKICDTARGLIPGTFFEVYDSLAPAIKIPPLIFLSRKREVRNRKQKPDTSQFI